MFEFQNEANNYILKNTKETTTQDICALKWITKNEYIYLYGFDDCGLPKLIKTDYRPSLFIWVNSDLYSHLIKNIRHIDRRRKVVAYKSLSFETASHIFESIESYYMVEIPCQSYISSYLLYQMFNDINNPSIRTIGSWNVEMMMYLHLYIKNKKFTSIYYKHFNGPSLACVEKSNFNLPVLAFDIETVSHEHFRVPLGNVKSDIIFSISIYTSIRQYTLINIPSSEHWPPKVENKDVIYFDNEIDLLRYALNILDTNYVYYLLGYNSKSYDMNFLLNRCTYLNLPEASDFIVDNGMLSYKSCMIHIDMNLLILKYFKNELTSFSLKNVSTTLLENSTKVDFNAINLRWIFKDMLEKMTFEFPKYNVTLNTLIDYNNVDTILLIELWNKLQYQDFLEFISCNFNINILNICQCGLNQYLSNKMIIEALYKNKIFTQHPSEYVIHNTSASTIYIDNDNLVQSQDSFSYGGGFNFRESANDYKDVVSMDALAYYPQVIDGFNLSHETIAIVKVQVLQKLQLDFDDYDFYRFCSHKNIHYDNDDSKYVNIITNRDYIYGALDNGSKIEDIKYYLQHSYKDNKILIIKRNVIGILSMLIKDRNQIRTRAKESKKEINSIIDKYVDYLLTINDDDDDDDDFDDDDDDDDDVEKKEFTIKDIEKKQSYEHEINIYDCKYKILTLHDFKSRYTNVEFAIKENIRLMKLEYHRINSQYRNMKIVNNSIYGLVGSPHGILKGIHVAAVATMFGRKYIIEAAKIAQTINCKCIYSDTDSIFIQSDKASIKRPIKYIQDEFSKKNSCLLLQYKLYSYIYIIAKKIYIAKYEGETFSRGITKYGPTLWLKTIDKFANEYIFTNTPHITIKDVKPIMKDLYLNTYKQIETDKNLLLCTSTCLEEYKTNTPIKMLMEDIIEKNPNYVFDKKITYFHYLLNTIEKPVYRIDHELENTPISKLNIYMFYVKINKTLYAILANAIKRTNLKRNVIYPYEKSQFKLDCISAFIDARKEYINARGECVSTHNV